MSDPFEIIVGTYEQYLLGYKVNNTVSEYQMERTFAAHSHLTSVRSVASNKHYLASGGADDFVYLYDMRYRVESGKLMHHNDTVNCIVFTPEASHLFTCSKDGTIAAIRCGSWQVEKHWEKSHKGLGVNTLAIHPTGKIALSTGADGILRTWNLVKGRQAYATNLVPRLKLDAKNVNILKWSPNGEKYLLAVNQIIDIYSVELAGIDSEIKFDSKIICVEFLEDDLIAVGLENGQIKLYDLEKLVQTVEAIAHDIRVKCMAFKNDLLVTASSSGEIKLWRYSKHKLDMLQSVNCGARITCLTISVPYKKFVHDKKVKSKEEQEVSKKKKFKLCQEVVIEKHDGWEVTSIDTAEPKSLQASAVPDEKKNKFILKKKKRKDESFDDAPVKKNKLSTGYENGTSNKKRKDRSIFVEEYVPFKRVERFNKEMKVINEKISAIDMGKFNKLKIKPALSKENNDVPLKKLKKETITEESGAILKKKKKKQ